MSKSDFGLIGLAVMGQNLVLNVANRGFSASVYNRTVETMTAFINGPAQGTGIQGHENLEDFVSSLERPRKVMLMVQAGPPVDAVIEQLNGKEFGGSTLRVERSERRERR